MIPIFIGRERELTSLKEFYEKDGIGMTVIYGRRRIGKSTLITEFVKDKKTIFYTENIYVEIQSFVTGLLDYISDNMAEFMLVTNFGTRQSKGFGYDRSL